MKVCIIVVFVAIIAWTTSLNIIDSYAPFNVYWNAPTFQCRSHKIYFEELISKYNIIVNKNDAFKGEEITILYDPGNFPALLYSEGSNVPFLRNGGLPQEGNLTDHLIHFEERVLNDIPSANYDGIAVIDFESWRPIFRQNWGALLPYKNLSVENERRKHPTWTEAALLKQATKRFEKAGSEYVDLTLTLAKSLRPNATWGYYAYPYCFNMQGSPLEEMCSAGIQQENDRLDYMFEISDGLFPSLYLPEIRLNAAQRVQLIQGRLAEAIRINKRFGNSKKILPYFWYIYQDSRNFLSIEDVRNAFILFKSQNLDGAIIWGSSNDVNSKAKCEKLYQYIDKVLGPAIITT